MTASVRVRMYRTGFGDCFLITLGSTASAQHILIDFGAHMHGEIGTMDEIMDDLEATTKKRLKLLVATHAHRDHISGFGKFAGRFAAFAIDEVWLPWTDDPSDPDAAALQNKHLALYDRLEKHLRLSAKPAGGRTDYNVALDALSNLAGNEKATTELQRGFGTGAKVRFLKGGERLEKACDVAGLVAEILGPPGDKSFLSRMDPPADQRFLAAPGDETGDVHPFPDQELAQSDPDFKGAVAKGQPEVPPAEMQKLDDLAESPAERLALALDSVRNNTSLVILFRYAGKALLFPGDAQWGNWQSWITTDSGRRVLGDVDFLKVAHHGSENATPVGAVEGLRASGVAAMVSTQIKPFPTIPRLPLLDNLKKHCEGPPVRSDWIDVDGAPEDPDETPKLPKGFSRGSKGTVFIDYRF